MNQRIRELVGQAKFMAEETTNKQISKNAELDAFAEKFAELIVKECIDIVSPYAIRMENFDGGHPIADLKKHFGVES